MATRKTTTRKKAAPKQADVAAEETTPTTTETKGLVEVVANKAFNDKQTNRVHPKGERFSVTLDRLSEITSKNASLVSVVTDGEVQS